MTELFRPEAIREATTKIGSPAGQFGVRRWVLITFLAIIMLSSIVFISAAHYTKKETVIGIVVPTEGVMRITAMRGGIIKQRFVAEGGNVREGQPLFLLSYNSPLEDGRALSEQLATTAREQREYMESQSKFKIKQISQNQSELAFRIGSLRSVIKHQVHERSLQDERVHALEKDFNAAHKLFNQGFVSEAGLMQKRDLLLAGQQQLSEIDQNLDQYNGQVEQLQSQILAAASAQSEEEANLKLNRAQFVERQLLNNSSDSALIVALKAGKLTNVQSRVGDIVAANQTLGLVVPDLNGSGQEVNLWVPSRAIGFVHTGTRVRLMFDAFPYQTYGVGAGRVTAISTAPLMPNELPIPIDTREQMYKLTVSLDRNYLKLRGRNWELMPGMRLSADLVLDEKSLLDWLLDPLQAAQMRAL